MDVVGTKIDNGAEVHELNAPPTTMDASSTNVRGGGFRVVAPRFSEPRFLRTSFDRSVCGSEE